MAKQIYINLPVKDLTKTMAFFSQLGFHFNQQFTNEQAACMIIGDNIFAMLLVEPFFKSFIKKEIADTSKTTEVLLCLSAESRQAVDDLVHKAFAAGGTIHNEKQDLGFMYGWGFQDIDGHLWEVAYMEPNAGEQS